MTSITSLTTIRELKLPTGVTLRCADLGPSEAPAWLLLHGYSDSCLSFSPILELLPPNVRFIIPDQRGHGESERPPDGYAVNDLARDAVAVLQCLRVSSVTVVGHSMGSFVAQRMAYLAPECVRRLVLVGSTATPASEPVKALLEPVQQLRDPVDEGFVRDFQNGAVHRSVAPEIMNRVIQESLKLPARVWKAILAGLLAYGQPVTDVACPVDIVWGDRDATFGRADQEELLRRIPHARLHVLNDVGHTPQWEAPDEFAAWLVTNLA